VTYSLENTWEEALGQAVERNLLVFDSEAWPKTFTPRLIGLMKNAQRDNCNSDITTIRKIYVPFSNEEYLSLGDAQYTSDGDIYLYGVRLVPTKRLEVSGDWYYYIVNILKAIPQEHDTFFVVAMCYNGQFLFGSY